ncbi:sulfite exporter TauE/SafE family protein [Ramlibacter sp. Leaf400]|uniref:sulfite exporter TauE/SafE family protein n=1 Tax=Ramlibacter sp. Leaf400 TaxID=1736365 RepID=UPI0006F9231C|nr:sulfite exporter TauE/SafE family protein [Ramlibacter sp. Leaf400]KQT11549.1 hypothetical protein ASG30_06680 [Ramlibacter sp. Leaf400]
MFDAHLPEFFLVSTIFFGAGLVKGVLGMGLPTFAMGFLGLLMPVPQAASLLTVPSLVTNLWQALAGGALRRLLQRLWGLQLGILLGVACAAWLPATDERFGRMLLGACLLAYGLCGLAGWKPRPPARAWERVAAPLVGGVTGVITALTGVFVLPAVPYLQSLQLDRHQLAQALGLSFTTSTLALAALLAANRQLDLDGSVHSALALAPALAGMVVGQKLREEMSEALFRRCFFVGLVLLGAWLVAR